MGVKIKCSGVKRIKKVAGVMIKSLISKVHDISLNKIVSRNVRFKRQYFYVYWNIF